MNPRAMPVGAVAQTDLPGQRIKRAMNVCAIQPMPPAGDEHIRRHGPLLPMTLPSAEVFGEHRAGRGMQRHQPSLAELGAADGQHRGLEIDIAKLEVAGFASVIQTASLSSLDSAFLCSTLTGMPACFF
jgi:hypothetical protein